MADEFDSIPKRKIALWIVTFIVLCIAIDWISTGSNFFLYKFFAPRQEAVRRQVYEGTKSYHQGSVQRLSILCTQVADADDDHKVMLNDVIEQEFAEWDVNDVPAYLHPCLSAARAR